jgi:hypothetical protein
VAGDFELNADAAANRLCRQVAQALASKLRVRTHYETRPGKRTGSASTLACRLPSAAANRDRDTPARPS